jgi:hypothetical protein
MDSIGLMECKNKSLNYVQSVLIRSCTQNRKPKVDISLLRGYDSREVGSDI